MKKICSDCKKTLSKDNFYKKGLRLQSKCKKCHNKYCIKRWTNRKVEAIEYMGTYCLDCNKSYHYSVFEFHHLIPYEKDMSWIKMRLTSKDKMKKELDKCVLLCANCHRTRHALSI
jgi:uridine phosphorylase